MKPTPRLHIATTDDLALELLAIHHDLSATYTAFQIIAERLDKFTTALNAMTKAIETQTPRHETN